MDYEDVDRVLDEYGLASDLAFRDVFVSIAPIPKKENALGLYYPGSELIVVPPECEDDVLLHELGHRYGHYYHGNLTEVFAETFRRQAMRGNTLIMTTDVERAEQAEKEAPMGMLEVRFYTDSVLAPAEMQQIFSRLDESGVDLRSVHQGVEDGFPYVGVVYNREAPLGAVAALPLAIIPLIAFGMIAALVGIGIFKLEDITSSIAKLLLIVFGGTIVIAALARKPVERYLERR